MLDGLFTTPVYSRRRDRFVNSEFPDQKNFAPKSKYIYDKQIWKQRFAEILRFRFRFRFFTEGRLRTSSNRAAIFISTSCERTTQQTFFTINLASQMNTTKFYFSSRVRKQFKLSTVPFKPLRCCLRGGKLVKCHIWKFCKDLFLNFRVIWSVNQIALFNGFLSDFIEITSCVYTKTIILFNLGEYWL